MAFQQTHEPALRSARERTCTCCRAAATAPVRHHAPGALPAIGIYPHMQISAHPTCSALPLTSTKYRYASHCRTDVMYVEEAVQPLVASLVALARAGRGGGGGGRKGAIADGKRSADGAHAGSGRPEEQGKPDKAVRQSEAAADQDGAQGDDQDRAAASRAAQDGSEPVPQPCDRTRGSRGDSGSGGGRGVGKWKEEAEGEEKQQGGAGGAVVYLAHGRNRFAEAAFWRCAGAAGFVWEELGEGQLHPDFQCSDVSVYRMVLRE